MTAVMSESETSRFTPEVKAKILVALRSGDYVQGTGFLRRETPGGDRWCCLGVICDVAVREGVIPSPVPATSLISPRAFIYGDPRNGEATFLPSEVTEWARVRTSPVVILRRDDHRLSAHGYFGRNVTLTQLNDTGVPLTVIADIIEEYM